MRHDAVKVKFENKVNPNSPFDLVKLEELFNRTPSNHNPEQHHKVEFFIMIFITEGQGYHTIDFTDYKYEKGTLLTIRKDQIHKFFKGNNTKGYLLLFMDEFLISYLEKMEAQKTLLLFNELLGKPKIHLSKSDFETVKEIIGRMENEYLEKSDEYSLGIIRSELHILITKLYRIKSGSDQIISPKKYLKEFIEFQSLVESDANKTNKVIDYAKMMSISTKTLNSISQSVINKTAKEFIDETRIKQVKRLLINTSLSIKEIAYESGFLETTNFYKYFKKRVGMTPEQFRQAF